MSRHRARSPRGPWYNRTAHRLREIEHIVDHRYDGRLPDTDDADIILSQVADCIVHMIWKKGLRPNSSEVTDRLELWCERRAPDVSVKLRREAARLALRRTHIDDADTCGDRLRLSYEERTLLGLTTIGSYDVRKAERTKRAKARKRERDRARMAKKRAAAGRVTRAAYLANCLTATRPWEEEGVSRRTWERRRKARATRDEGRIVSTSRADAQWPRASRAAVPCPPRPAPPRRKKEAYSEVPVNASCHG
jgi:hypothetical protein